MQDVYGIRTRSTVLRTQQNFGYTVHTYVQYNIQSLDSEKTGVRVRILLHQLHQIAVVNYFEQERALDVSQKGKRAFDDTPLSRLTTSDAIKR